MDPPDPRKPSPEPPPPLSPPLPTPPSSTTTTTWQHQPVGPQSAVGATPNATEEHEKKDPAGRGPPVPRPPSGVSHSSENLELLPVPKIHNTQIQGPNKVGQVSHLSSSNIGSSQTPVADAVYDVEAATVSLKQEKPKSGRKSRRVQIHDVETGLESLESKKSKSPRKRGKIKRMMTVG